MDFQVYIRHEAEDDLREAYHWYEDCRKGLGDDFILCIEETLNRIIQSPRLYQVAYKKIRRAFIRRFPFGIFYLIEENKIIVLAVMHARREPKLPKRRGLKR